MKRKRILCFFGTRPEAIKMAPVIERLKAEPNFQVLVGVSAQHRAMLDQVLKAFRIKSDIDLDLMRPKQSLSDITVRVLEKFGPVLDRHRPDMVLVHGDTTTTLAGTLASYYKQIPVGHVEAGLRTNDLYRPFPEEANRQLTDALATLHFCPTNQSRQNLVKENRNLARVFVTGNTVIDALLETVQRKPSFINKKMNVIIRTARARKRRLVLMTAHRRENFGEPFERVLSAVIELSKRFPKVEWIYPVHPNPHVQGPAFRRLGRLPNIHLTDPLDYVDLVQVMNACTIVVTDSGGLQEEAPSLGKPVLVLRDVTERPEAVQAGTVQLVGTNKQKILRESTRLFSDSKFYRKMANAVNPYGDGNASRRIVQAIQWYFGFSEKKPSPFRPVS